MNNISLELKAGEIVGILGASGSGKTTLLRILSGQDKPDRGDVQSSVHQPGPQFGYLLQNDQLLPWRSALSSVALGLEFMKISAAEAKRVAYDVPARRELATMHRDYVREQQAWILVVTHSVEEVCCPADRILLLTRSPARLFKEIRIADTGNGLTRENAPGYVMHDLCVALGAVA